MTLKFVVGAFAVGLLLVVVREIAKAKPRTGQ